MNDLVQIVLNFKDRFLTNSQFIALVSALIGLLVGFAAVAIKNSVHFIQTFIKSGTLAHYNHSVYFILPMIGIALVLVFIKYILRKPIYHGIPNLLYSIAETRGHIKKHNLFSSIIASAFTVGFGGSVGLEGPTVATGAAYGSAVSLGLKIPYKQVILMLGAASAAALSAIFKAPLAGVVFAMEVIMIDLTVSSVVPLIIASVTAILTSYFFMGTEVLYHFDLKEMYKMSDLPYFALLGIITGLLSLYFTKVYLFLNVIFKKLKNIWVRLLLGGSLLGALIYLFPALYGEGYEVINQALNGNLNAVIESPLLSYFVDNPLLVFLVVFLVILLKSFATSLTIASGGVGGIFAPTLFNGSIIGLLFAQLMTHFGKYLPASNFALVGMAGTIAGVLHAPLTAIFLIAEISGGYQLLIPLMIVSLISFITTRAFMSKSVYTFQLAERGQLLTHHADNNILKMMDVRSLLETDFKSVKPDAKLRDLVDAIQQSNRNIFPVVDEAGVFKGMISMEDVRKIIFKPQLYYSVTVDSLMIQPQVTILPNETMNSIASKLHKTSYYNIPVLDDNNHYLGFVSRANVFSEYRKLLKDFSSE